MLQFKMHHRHTHTHSLRQVLRNEVVHNFWNWVCTQTQLDSHIYDYRLIRNRRRNVIITSG